MPDVYNRSPTDLIDELRYKCAIVHDRMLMRAHYYFLTGDNVKHGGYLLAAHKLEEKMESLRND